MRLKQFIPQEACLSCDVCCRFPDSKTIWAPLFTYDEIKNLVDSDILPPALFTDHQKYSKTKAKTSQRINLISYRDYFICPCFNHSNNHCKIYDSRPFECQLYPFLLMRQNNKFYLAKDKKCPYFDKIEQKELEKYKNYLKNEIRNKDIICFFKKNRDIFCEYPAGDLELLFPIEII
jgi:Fe-S-cluster containining protein